LFENSNAAKLIPMIDEETLAQMNGKYLMPPDAGPAWRAAVEYGFDMSLIEESLKLTPEQRLAEHQQVINFLIEVQESNQSHAAK
jgi:hypothetical protein